MANLLVSPVGAQHTARRPHASRRVTGLILARMLLILLSVCLLVMRAVTTDTPGPAGTGLLPRAFQPESVYILLLALFGLNLVYLGLLPHVTRRLDRFVGIQLLVDVAAITALVFFTGAVNSSFALLYFLSITAGTMLLSRRESALFASLATVGLAGVTGLYLAGLGLEYVPAPYHVPEGLHPEIAVERMLLVVLAFFMVAYLTGLLKERLELAHSLNEEVLQNMAEGVGVFDTEGQLAFMNGEFEMLFSPERALRLGESVESVFPLVVDAGLRKLVANRIPSRFEVESVETGTDARPPLEIRISPLGPPAKPRGTVVIGIDLTMLRRAEMAERRAERFSALSEMAASLAHEIRNPLASVRGSIQELSSAFPAGSPDARLAEIVIKESDRLDGIITNFLQYARQRPLRLADCSLARLLQEVAELLENRVDARGVTIDRILDETPPVRCDPEMIREVFLNLGVNAVTAMRRGTLTIRCPHPRGMPPGTVVLRRHGDPGVTISFEDTGPGLAPGSEDRIFDPFFTTKESGTGLGLAVARRTVEAHDGRLWVESRAGRGATFFVWLPLAGPYRPGVPRIDTVETVPA
jgi:two-component system sensor histidine kinase PilS (NtrC family)